LRSDPELILPVCMGECRRCPWDKIQRQLVKIQDARDDEKALARYAKGGDKLARAYAATLQLALDGKAPYLAVLRTEFGSIPYAYRGKTSKEKLVGVQHYDDPMWRLFGVLDIVKKKKLHIYSLEDKMICTGTEPHTPPGFVDEMVKTLKYQTKRKGKIITCHHLEAGQVKKSLPSHRPYLRIKWHSAETVIAACQRCTRSAKSHTFGTLVSRMASPDTKEDFTVQIVAKPKCMHESKPCPLGKAPKIDPELLERYMNGETDDEALFSEHLDFVLDFYRDLGTRAYVAENKCYGKEMSKFLKSLNPEDDEKVALQAMLKGHDKPVVVDKATANKVLSSLWDGHGIKGLTALTGDAKSAREIFKNSDISEVTPSQVLREAAVGARQKHILTALPRYEKLPDIAKFADDTTRIYKTRGTDDLIRAIEKYRGGDTKIKSVAYSFLLALGKGEGKKWQYTKTELDFAQYLKDPSLELLEADPENYHEALQALVRATGSTAKIEKAS